MPGAKQPYETFWGSTIPTNTGGSTVALVNYGLAYQFTVKGHILGLRYARENRSSGFAIGQIFTNPSALQLDRVVLFRKKTAGATGFDRWENKYFTPWLAVAANDIVGVAVWFQSVRMKLNTGGLTAAAVTHGHIIALKDNPGGGGPNGQTGLDCGVPPSTSTGGALYGIDVIFLPG